MTLFLLDVSYNADILVKDLTFNSSTLLILGIQLL